MGKKIVSIHIRKYSYQNMQRDLKELADEYGDVMELSVFGESLDGNLLYCMRIGEQAAENSILLQSSMHGREWINTQLVMMMAERLMQKYHEDTLWMGIPYRQILKQTAVYLVPMLNPDGVIISQHGPDGINDPALQEEVLRIAEETKLKDYRYWKANAGGVDLNRNYACGFGGGDTAKGRRAAFYHGEFPESEPESRAFADLIRRIHPQLVVNYHAAGRLIYYRDDFPGLNLLRSMTRYSLKQETGKPYGTLGDFLTAEKTDWCTPETCIGSAPVWHIQIYLEWFKHRDVLPALLYRSAPSSFPHTPEY